MILRIECPDPVRTLGHLTALIRLVRPMPELRALAEVAAARLLPGIRLDAPLSGHWHTGADGRLHWVLVGGASTEAQRDTGGAPGWESRAGLPDGPQVRRLGNERLAYTDDPDFVDARQDELDPPAARPRPTGDLHLLASLGALVKQGGVTGSALEGTLSLRVELEDTAVRLAARLDSPPELAVAASLGLARPVDRELFRDAPADAPVVVAGDASNLAIPALRALFAALPALETMASLWARTRGLPGVTQGALAPLLDRVKSGFFFSVQAAPGARQPGFFLAARADRAVEGQPATATAMVEYRLGELEVRRLDGPGPLLPVDTCEGQGMLWAAGGEGARAELEGVLGGRLAAGLRGHPALEAALEAPLGESGDQKLLFITSVDIAGLYRLLNPGVPPEFEAPAAPMIARIFTVGRHFEADLALPVSQLKRVAPWLRTPPPDSTSPGPDPGSTDWLFPEGI